MTIWPFWGCCSWSSGQNARSIWGKTKDNKLYGLVWKADWFTDPLIDPLRLEHYFDTVFQQRFSETA